MNKRRKSQHDKQPIKTTDSSQAIITKAMSVARNYCKPFLIIFAIYTIAMLSIIRANYSYMDDIGRSIHGYAWNHDFNRYSSSLLSYILNTNTNLADISPIPQLVAMAIMSIVSILTVKSISSVAKKSSKLAYIPTLLIGLCPFMLGCWVFKFDAPCMALSILASVIPGLLYKSIKVRKYIAVLLTAILTLLMWTSYQASSGIMPVFIMSLVFIDLITNKSKVKNCLRRAIPMTIGYAIGTLLFYLSVAHANAVSYRQVGAYPMNQIISGLWLNIQQVLSTIASSSTKLWMILVVAILVSFILTATILGKSLQSKLRNLALGITFILIAIPLSYGSYLILQEAPYHYGRSLVGFSFLTGLIPTMAICLAGTKRARGMITLLASILAYSFAVYALALGNGLADQKQFANNRVAELSNELSAIYRDKSLNGQQMRIVGDIGMSPVMKHLDEVYPVTDNVAIDLQTGLNGHSVWGYRLIKEYFSWDIKENVANNITCTSIKSKSHLYTISEDNRDNICVNIN